MTSFKSKIGFSLLMASLMLAATAVQAKQDADEEAVIRSRTIYEENGKYYYTDLTVKELSLEELKTLLIKDAQKKDTDETSFKTSRREVKEKLFRQHFHLKKPLVEKE